MNKVQHKNCSIASEVAWKMADTYMEQLGLTKRVSHRWDFADLSLDGCRRLLLDILVYFWMLLQSRSPHIHTNDQLMAPRPVC